MVTMHIEDTLELAFENVTAGWDGAPVVHDLSFTLGSGERLGLIGRNGAGKSTSLACAMGLSQLQSGRVLLNRQDMGPSPTHLRARAGLAYVPQGRDIFKTLSVEENLLAAVQSRSPRMALERAYDLFPRLHERRRNGGGQLSGGEQQMLAVARALMSGPKIVLFDEPLEGLAPKVRDELMEAIRRLVQNSGVGCLLVEQHVDVVLDFVDRVIVLERGITVFSGSSAELRADLALLDRTIGLEKV
jgi:branched-chain amino acid transport system ATP-binding protein